LTPAQFTDGVKGDDRQGEVKGTDTCHTRSDGEEERREASREGHEEWDRFVVGEDMQLLAMRGGDEMLGREEREVGEIRRRWRPFGVIGQ
jgi:hypothetical protein